MSKIFGKMVKNERYFLDYFSFLICFNSYFNSCAPRWAQPISFSINIRDVYFNSCIQGGMQRFCLIIVQALSIAISIHAPAMGATARFRYYLAIYTIFCICILLFIQSYLIIISILFYLILGNVRKKVFRYSSGLFNMIFHIVFISLQIRTFCFARVIAV